VAQPSIYRDEDGPVFCGGGRGRQGEEEGGAAATALA